MVLAVSDVMPAMITMIHPFLVFLAFMSFAVLYVFLVRMIVVCLFIFHGALVFFVSFLMVFVVWVSFTML